MLSPRNDPSASAMLLDRKGTVIPKAKSDGSAGEFAEIWTNGLPATAPLHVLRETDV